MPIQKRQKFYLHKWNFRSKIYFVVRRVAQFGRALRSGRRGRGFESRHADIRSFLSRRKGLFWWHKRSMRYKHPYRYALNERKHPRGANFTYELWEMKNGKMLRIKRFAKKLKPQYNGDIYLETVRCYFDTSQENLEKCRYTYQGNETYAFLLSDKYIMALYTHYLVERKEVALQEMQIEGFSEKEYAMVRLWNVRDVLLQALLVDDMKWDGARMRVNLYAIYTINCVE